VAIGAANKPGIRERKKEETRRVILKCANALFHERGYATATLEDIAQRAGVHKQTVLRYFGSKEAIALAFRQIALQKFKAGLLDPERKTTVLEYWRNFIEASAREVAARGDMVRYSKLMESEPDLIAASLGIHLQYEELLASALSREAGLDPESDLESRLLAAFLVAANFSIARHLLICGRLQDYRATALEAVDLAVRKFSRNGKTRLQPAKSVTG